jgi:hypothetical protein
MGFTSGKLKKNAFFHDILYLKNMFRAKKKFRLPRGIAATAVALRDRELKF